MKGKKRSPNAAKDPGYPSPASGYNHTVCMWETSEVQVAPTAWSELRCGNVRGLRVEKPANQYPEHTLVLQVSSLIFQVVRQDSWPDFSSHHEKKMVLVEVLVNN